MHVHLQRAELIGTIDTFITNKLAWMYVFISWWLEWQTLMLIFHERKQIEYNCHTNAIHLINYNLFGAVIRIYTYVSNWVENMLILITKQQDAMRIFIRFSKRLITNRMIFPLLWSIYQLIPQINYHGDVCFQSHSNHFKMKFQQVPNRKR